jgi:hypothetical protein
MTFDHRRSLPDFLGIGASRSGTTWLYENLKRHPEIWMPPIKEVHYFDTSHLSPIRNEKYHTHLRRRLRKYLDVIFRRDITILQNISWDIHFFFKRRNLEWYRAIFHPETGQIAGEITPTYSMLDREIIKEIYGLNPELKIVYFMRNPIDRAWSSAVKDLVRKKNRIEEIPDTEYYKYFEDRFPMGDYVQTLLDWESVFGKGSLCVFFFDDLEKNPRHLLLSVYRFLEIQVDEEYIPDEVAQKVNSTEKYKSAIPKRFEAYLSRRFLPQLQELSQRFGDPVSGWRDRAEKIIESNN